ncbi:MAG TPA: phosphoribosylanthranilate isomerase, partial [Acidimicrobiales bacterium]|nr:phosphoribosylanthranilate isomerase [Acidimicrobiales bacterium]
QAFPAGGSSIVQAGGYSADAIMIDAPSPGSGEVFDWSLADGVPDGVRLLLAGGLNPSNVGEAIARVHPWGVDVATGVESAPGHKDPVKVRAFVAAAKAAGADPYKGDDELVPYDWEETGG